MLFHRLHAPRSGVDIEQMITTLRESVNAPLLRRAWNLACATHPALRTRVRWEGLPSPVQEVLPGIEPAWSETDLSGLSPTAQSAELAHFLRQDRERGVELDADQLHRFTLFRLAENEFRFVWTFPHLALDGGSFPIVVRDAFNAYDALLRGAEPKLRAPRPFADHIAWLAETLPQRAAPAAAHFGDLLKGFSAKNELCDRGKSATQQAAAPRPEVGPRLYGHLEQRLDALRSDRLRTLAREHALTLNTFVQAAWALVVSDFSTEQDVVFGVVRASRRTAFAEADEMVGMFINTLPLRTHVESQRPVMEWLAELRAGYVAARAFEHTPLLDVQAVSEVPKGTSLFDSAIVYNDALMNSRMRALGGAYEQREFEWLEQTNFPITLFAYGEPELLLCVSFDPAHVSAERADAMLQRAVQALVAIAEQPERRVGDLERIPDAELDQLRRFNATTADLPAEACIHEAFEAQVERTPDAVAVVFKDQALSYRELDERANRVARRLQAVGVGPDSPVGIFVERSAQMLVGLLGILKAGAAYLPLDPNYPADRIAVMLEDSRAGFVVTDAKLASRLPDVPAQRVLLDDALLTSGDPTRPPARARGHNLAYVIFTSGSTGRPKGVMVEHRNVANFFAGMDERIGEQGGTWLAVTSISFDISVLELFWTLARGFKVVIQQEADKAALTRRARATANQRPLHFSLFYFSADAQEAEHERYRLLLDGARFADRNGFMAVWTPERHFHAFGGLYPNPSLTSAAIATITERIQLRAGSVVLPLHNPLRIAEEWSVVDNLSNGRVGLSFASGWHANDFALMPENFAARRELTFKGVELIRKLWKGEAVTVKNGAGVEISVKVLPRPVQAEPPIWLTTAGNIETFRAAGQLGVNVLTNMLGQGMDDLREKLAAYRQARRESGHAGEGHVTVMLHTFVGRDVDEVRDLVRDPFTAYLKTSTDLVKKARWEFPAFGRPAGEGAAGVEDRALTPAEEDALMAHAFERYFTTHGLFGTPDSCLELANRLRDIGVDELACLIDFGVATELVLANLENLRQLGELCNPQSTATDGQLSIAQQLKQHAVTHFQCTPSLARLLVEDPEARVALSTVRKMMLGGEALPPALADELLGLLTTGELLNMYGPTETTVWSTTAKVAAGQAITIGRPFANTRIQILDKHLRPSPPGVAGELCIGGAGVARGYWERPELTSERFIQDQMTWDSSAHDAGKVYRTGDLARFASDGSLVLLGRQDHQIKLRGYRIELGEIEAVLDAHPAVREAVCVLREDTPGDARLVAYATLSDATDDAGIGRAGQWQEIWDEAYRPSSPAADARFDTSGWNSSYTGEPIAAAEMADWLSATVERIRGLGARRVLEIGCGTGLILYRLAPHVERYLGCDFAAVGLDKIRAELRREPLPNVEFVQASALEVPLEAGAYDAIVINSVVQYFPSVEYLIRVLERALPALAPAGALFVGDVRSLELLEAFHTSVVISGASSNSPGNELVQAIERRVAQDSELVLSPAFFAEFAARHPELASVRIEPKRGRLQSELQAFRYDVTLRKSAGPLQRPLGREEVLHVPASEVPSLAALRALLATEPPAVHVSALSNGRVAPHLAALRELRSSPKRTLAELPNLNAHGGWEPEDIYTAHPGYQVELVWSADASHFDAWLLHTVKAAERVRAHSSWSLPANGATSRIGQRSAPGSSTRERPELRSQLRTYLSEHLPDYMVPSSFVFMERLPLTPNGKIDRKALPTTDERPTATTAGFAPASSDAEKSIAAVWAELLGVAQIGIHDNLFDLGANSLLVMQANARLRAALGKQISLVEMFEFPTVASLAEHLARGDTETSTQAADAGASRAQARREAMLRRRVQPATQHTPKR
jgi:natural product biosynthesis luciferase-like monooxygenase protein